MARTIEEISKECEAVQAEIDAKAEERSAAEREMRASKKRLDGLRSELLAAYQTQATAPKKGQAK